MRQCGWTLSKRDSKTVEIAMMYWDGHDIGGWGIAIMVISMTLLWAAVIVGIVLIARGVGNRPQNRGESLTLGAPRAPSLSDSPVGK
jgi:hypothetical protein